MKLYAEDPRYRLRQLLADVGAAAWCGLWLWLAWRVYEAVTRLGAPGETLEEAGESFARALEDFGEEVGDVPVVGEALGEPFATVAEGGRILQRAGIAQQNAVETLALWLAGLLAALAISYVLYRYLPERVRWVREASAAHALRIASSDLQLFAMRALVNRPLYELRRAAPDPAGAFFAGDYEALARVELAALGLSTPPEGRTEKT